MTPYGFWGDVILFGVFIVVFSFCVPKCAGEETDLQPFLIVRKGVAFVLRWTLMSVILASAVVLFTLACVVTCAFVAVLLIGAFTIDIFTHVFTKRKRK